MHESLELYICFVNFLADETRCAGESQQTHEESVASAAMNDGAEALVEIAERMPSAANPVPATRRRTVVPERTAKEKQTREPDANIAKRKAELLTSSTGEAEQTATITTKVQANSRAVPPQRPTATQGQKSGTWTNLLLSLLAGILTIH